MDERRVVPVATIAERVLAGRAVSRPIVVRSGHQVEVSPAPGSVALVPLLVTGPYGTAVKKICRALEGDPAIISWLAVSDCSRFLFRQVPGDPEGHWEFERGSVDMAVGDIFAIAQVDLAIYKEVRPSRAVIQRRAKDNVRIILTRLGGYLQSPAPHMRELS